MRKTQSSRLSPKLKRVFREDITWRRGARVYSYFAYVSDVILRKASARRRILLAGISLIEIYWRAVLVARRPVAETLPHAFFAAACIHGVTVPFSTTPITTWF
jgi:hypothetical protein